MKKTLRLVSVLLAMILAMTAFASCGSSKAADTTAAGDTTTADTASSDDGLLKIGIIQYVSHPSLDNCYEGISNTLMTSSRALKIDRQVGSDASPDSDCENFAKNMVADGYDLIFAIATPAAISAYAATEGTDIPVIFCAVSDPVAAELVQSVEEPGDLCTGTSDVLDFEAQLDLIQAMQPEAKSIGVLYTTSEANSISQLALFKDAAETRGLTVDAMGIQNDSDIPAAAADLVSRVDCVNNFTDNKVVNNLSVLIDAANGAGIPVYGSEVEQVKNGCLASMSIDYIALGAATGQMGLSVLNGEDIKKMAVKFISETTPVVNSEVLASFGFTLPAAYADAETVTTNK